MLNAQQIKELREELLLSQEEFSELFGVTRTTVSNWEKGKTKPTFKIMRKIKDKYNDIKFTITKEK